MDLRKICYEDGK